MPFYMLYPWMYEVWPKNQVQTGLPARKDPRRDQVKHHFHFLNIFKITAQNSYLIALKVQIDGVNNLSRNFLGRCLCYFNCICNIFFPEFKLNDQSHKKNCGFHTATFIW